METKIECVCTYNATRKAALAYLGSDFETLLAQHWKYRSELCVWWGVENWEDLPDEAFKLLRGYWNLLSVPWQITAERITGIRHNPNCYVCHGSGYEQETA